MWELVGLGVDPAERFHLFQVGVLRQLLRQVHLRERLTQSHTTPSSNSSNFLFHFVQYSRNHYLLVGSPLRGHHNTADLFHLSENVDQ